MKKIWKNIVVMAVFCLLGSTLNTVSATAASTSPSTSPDIAATNMIVDFTATSVPSNVKHGDTGVMNLVLKNSGGYKAENIKVHVVSTATVRADKTYLIGRMDPSESKTMPVIFTVTDTARTGITALDIQITYDGSRSDGTSTPNQVVTWEIPLTLVGNPLFQITPQKSTYYKDTVDNLTIGGISKDTIKDLEVTLSSSSSGSANANSNARSAASSNDTSNPCITVLGSSRAYVGNVGMNQPFNLLYTIKPTLSGACTVVVHLSYTDQSGGTGTDDVSIGLNVEDAGVNFKVMNISYEPTGPGQEADVTIQLMNVGHAAADDVSLLLNMSSPFAPIDTPEKYIKHVSGGETIAVQYKLGIDIAAITQTYSLPLEITYKVGGTTYTVEKDIGIDVGGFIQLAVMNVDTSKGNARISVSNIGTRDASSVKATLMARSAATGTSGYSSQRSGTRPTLEDNATLNRSRTGGEMQYLIAYQSSIKATKQATFTFTTTATGPATLLLEYTGLNNERVRQAENITLGSSSTTSGNGSSTTSTTTYIMYGAAAIVVLYVGYRFFKGRKTK